MIYSQRKTLRLQRAIFELGDALAHKGMDIERWWGNRSEDFRTRYPTIAQDLQDIGARVAAFSENPDPAKAAKLGKDLDVYLLRKYKNAFVPYTFTMPMQTRRRRYQTPSLLLLDYSTRTGGIAPIDAVEWGDSLPREDPEDDFLF